MAGSCPRERTLGSTCRRKALRAGESCSSLTRGQRKRSWFLARVWHCRTAGGARQGASEVALPAPFAAENAAMGQRRLRAGLVSSEPRRDACQATEAGGSPSSAPPPGAGSPRGGLAPYSAGLRGSRLGGPSEGGHRSAHCGARESGDSRVLVSNVSVAEVGETHLSHTGEVSREAIRAGMG